MAHQVAGRALWNRKNKQEQGLLINHPRYSDILNNKRPSLISTVQPASLWPHLRKYKVLGEHSQERITLNTTRAQQVDQLINHLEHGPMWQLHSFLRSCQLTDQQHIIHDLGLNPEMYNGPSPPDSDADNSFDISMDESIVSGVAGLSPSSPHTAGYVSLAPHGVGHREPPGMVQGKGPTADISQTSPQAPTPSPSWPQQQARKTSTEARSSRGFCQRMLDCLSCVTRDDASNPGLASAAQQTSGTTTPASSPVIKSLGEERLDTQAEKTSDIPTLSLPPKLHHTSYHKLVQEAIPAQGEAASVDRTYQPILHSESPGDVSCHVLPQPNLQTQFPAACEAADSPMSVTSSPTSSPQTDPLHLSHEPGKFEKTLAEALVVHCEYYKDHLMTGRVFDFKHRDSETVFYDIDDCYMQQDAEFHQYKSVADKIKLRDVLRKYGRHRMPRTVLLVGHPGVGKSTFFTRFAYCWSLAFLKHLQNPEMTTCLEETVVVYVPARSLTEDIWGSIEDELCCGENGRKSIMKEIRSKEATPDHASTILMDGIDEIRDDKILQALEAFLLQNHKHGGPQIFVSARTGLSRLDKSLFDRFLSLEGFTLSQGLDYTHKYITQNWKGTDVEQHSALVYIDRNKEELTPILRNPLKAHILSALAVEGLLVQNDDTVPQSIELLKMMESFFIKRENDGVGVSTEESGWFYQLCLYGLLENIRQFTEEDLKKLKVQQSPYVSFFRKEMKRDKSANNIALYSFEHEVLYEFFAARAIETLPEWKMKAVLLHIGSRKILRNLQKLMTGMLSDYAKRRSVPLLTGMIRLILVHASLDERSLNVAMSTTGLQTYTLRLKTLRGRIQDSLPTPGDLLCEINSEVTDSKKAILATWEIVDSLFNLLVNLMKTNRSPHTGDYWAQLYYGSKGFVPKVLLNMLTDCTEEYKVEVAKGTYLRMLPCHGFYACGDLRWLSISKGHITCWSTEDLKCIAQYRQRTAVMETPDRLLIHLHDAPSQWGPVPNDHWTPAAWDTALQAVTRQYSVTNKLTFCLTHDAPLKGLLDSLTRLTRSDFPGEYIEIQLGHISLEDLHQWRQWYQGSAGTQRIKLSATEFHLPADERKWKKLLWLLATRLLEDVNAHTVQCCGDERKHRLKNDYKISDTLTLSQPYIQFVSQC